MSTLLLERSTGLAAYHDLAQLLRDLVNTIVRAAELKRSGDEDEYRRLLDSVRYLAWRLGRAVEERLSLAPGTVADRLPERVAALVEDVAAGRVKSREEVVMKIMEEILRLAGRDDLRHIFATLLDMLNFMLTLDMVCLLGALSAAIAGVALSHLAS